MLEWWTGLSALHRAMYAVAIFFSTLFLWQLVATLLGLAGGEGLAGEADVGGDAATGDGADLDDLADGDLIEDAGGLATLRMLSVRSLLAFGMLFGWAGALYLNQDRSPLLAMMLALVWGLLGMVVVGLFFWMLPRLTEQGNLRLADAE
ncbi:MAG: hypothetical protein V1772_05725, partial [Chloroflexota bacterium]